MYINIWDIRTHTHICIVAVHTEAPRIRMRAASSPCEQRGRPLLQLTCCRLAALDAGGWQWVLVRAAGAQEWDQVGGPI